MKSRLRGSDGYGGVSPLPYNGGGGYGQAGRAQVVRLPPADVTPRTPDERAEIGRFRSALTSPQDFEDQLLERLVARLQDITIYDARRYATFTQFPITVGAVSQVILEKPTHKRVYLFIINTHATQTMFIDWDKPATAAGSVPIFPAGGFWEPPVIPQNIVTAIASAGGTTGVLTFAELPEKGEMRERG